MQGFDERFRAAPASVRAARVQIAAFAEAVGADAALLEDVRLAVSEAVTNAVQHGYRGGAGEIRVSAEVRAGELVIVVCDAGAGIDAPRIPERSGLGWGLRVVRDVADALEVGPGPSGGGTELRMRFTLGTIDPPLLLVA